MCVRGCTPRPAVVPAAGRQPQRQRPKPEPEPEPEPEQQQKRVYCGMAGWVRLRGTP